MLSAVSSSFASGPQPIRLSTESGTHGSGNAWRDCLAVSCSSIIAVLIGRNSLRRQGTLGSTHSCQIIRGSLHKADFFQGETIDHIRNVIANPLDRGAAHGDLQAVLA